MKGGEKRMKMTKIYCVILCLSLILSVFAGCQSSEKKDKTSSEKQTAASVSSETSTKDTSTIESSSSSSSQTCSNESPFVSNVSSDNERRPAPIVSIYPEEGYSIPRAPYEHPYCYGCDSVAETKSFILETDPYSFWDGCFISLIKMFKEDGYVLEFFYEGNSLFDEEKFVKASVGLTYEKSYTGVGYRIDFETKKGEEYCVNIFYLKEEWIEEAKEAPFLYSGGKNTPLSIGREEASEHGWIEEKIKANGKEFTVNYNISSPKLIFFVYDDYMIHAINVDDIQSFIENFSLTKIPLEE